MNGPLLDRVTLIAEDLGRLRKMGTENHVLDRLCGMVEDVDSMLRPTAGELCRSGLSVHDALAVVDGERAEVLRRLGTSHS